MIRLLLADLRQNLRSWTWTVVVAVVAATSIAAQLMVGRGGRIAAEATGDANMAEGATVLTSMQLIFVGLSVVVALSTVAALVVASRARDHGLWRAQGMRPGLLRMILLGQLALVGAGSAIVAIPVGIILPTARPQPHPVDLLILLILCTSLTVLGGRGAARRSSGAQIIALLREHDDVQGRSRRVRRRLLRGILIAVCLAGLIALPIIAQITESDHESIFTLVIGAGLAALVLMVVLTPRVTPALERTWTALIPSRSVAWHMARHSAAYEAGRSSATVMPFSLAIGLVGFAFGIRALGGNADVGGFIALFGTAFLVAWTGGVAVIAMSAGRRRRDGALLIAAGGVQAQVRWAQVLEGVIHAVTAAILGVASTVVGLCSESLILGFNPVPVVFLHGPWVEILAITGASLLTVCGATVLSSASTTPVAQLLRARD